VRIPYGSEYVVLCGVQAVAVLGPRASPVVRVLRRFRILGVIPLLAIGGAVLVMSANPDLAQQATDLATFATPIAFLGGFLAFRVRSLWVLAPVLYLIAWKATGDRHEVAIDVLIVGACATLAWLTGIVAPRRALAVGILVATAVDVYQVLASTTVATVAHALTAAAPPSTLPHLQEAVWRGASMGWGDVYLAALLGTVVASLSLPRRLLVAVVVFVAGLANGFEFLAVDLIPATVPVAVGVVFALWIGAGRGDRASSVASTGPAP
jgi:hypothetical protein